MEQKQLARITPLLLQWYDHHARILPWRDLPTPYRVWVSEIMLQQTRVDAVIPYFERFVSSLPDIEALASVGEERLFKLWEGLGYYNRARNLKKSAVFIMEKWNGAIPSRFEELQTLPGIGEYSAGAIASIAFGQRVPAVDGNVLRVIARITADDGDVTQTETKKRMREQVIGILPEVRIGDFNQSLMELGATVCLPNGVPLCSSCPLVSLCQAHHLGLELSLPVKQKKAPRRSEEKTVLLLVQNGKVALTKRPDKGLLPGMWEFPNVPDTLSPNQCRKLLDNMGLKANRLTALPRAVHIFSHVEWHLSGFLAELSSVPQNESLRWFDARELEESAALPTAFSAYKKELMRYFKKSKS